MTNWNYQWSLSEVVDDDGNVRDLEQEWEDRQLELADRHRDDDR